jgi:hypothetical protein|tara:strand:- start:664 stop:774 length:111 start_codon:yes stop_codon:yes gene_type:complete
MNTPLSWRDAGADYLISPAPTVIATPGTKLLTLRSL